MNLHEDREAFSEFVQVAAEKVGFPQVFVEKDYWVTKALKHLSESEYVDETVFKGGTSLSKAYRLIERFSEDIDLAIISNGKGDNVRKNLLKGIESEVAKSLIYIPNDVRESKGSKYRKTVYRYPHSIEDSGFGQVSSDLLIEVNAFTQPEPFEKRVLSSFIAEMLAGKQRSDLIEQYGLHDFSLNVLSVKRTLVEKILRIIRDSYHENPIAELSRQIRHIYDICLIMRKEEYQDFCQNKEFSSLCQKCIDFFSQVEQAGYWSWSAA